MFYFSVVCLSVVRTLPVNEKSEKISTVTLSMGGKWIVFDRLATDYKNRSNSPIIIYDAENDKSDELMMEGYDFCSPDLDGDRLSFCRIHFVEKKGAVSEIVIYNLTDKTYNVLSVTQCGYQPGLHGDFLVFKEAESLFHYGQINRK